MIISGYRVNATHVVSDVFEDGEAAVIDLRTGAYFSLNPTAALLWPLLVEGSTTESLVAHADASTDGGPEVGPAVESFVAALVTEGLVEEVADVDESPPPADGTPRQQFVPPELQRFDDLQELLLLDPIHDVTDQGWPHTASG
jgi:hypothetical protein